jgi:hypothetical protein
MSTDTQTNHLEPLSSDNGTNETVPHIKVAASHIARGTPVKLDYLINVLNYIHFSDGTITAVYRSSAPGDGCRNTGLASLRRWMSPKPIAP